jgi:Ca2+-transporting ATPase
LLLGPFFGLPIALLPIHILWINLVTDGLPAITLSFEKSEKDIMNRPPRPPQQSVFSNGRGFHMIWVGMLMAGIALGAQSYAIKNGLHWQTIVFNVLCLGQMAHILAVRKPITIFNRIFSNKPLIISVLLIFVLQAVVTWFPTDFKTESLPVT